MLLLERQQDGLVEMHPPKLEWFCSLGKKKEDFIIVLQSFGWVDVFIANVRGEKKEWDLEERKYRYKIMKSAEDLGSLFCISSQK